MSLGSGLFAVSLLVAAFTKASHPWLAASQLEVGLDFDARLLLVDGFSGVEGVVGAALLVFRGNRLVALGGCVLGAMLLLGHWLVAGAEDCGCYGRLQVPPWLVLASTATGFVACGILWRVGHESWRSGRLRLAGAGVLALLASGPMLVREGGTGTPDARLREYVHTKDLSRTLILVGSWTCPNCIQEAGTLRASRRSLLSAGIDKIVFAYRASEPRERVAALSWMRGRAIPDDLWWRLIRGKPPSFVRFDPRGLRVTTSLREMLSS